jgi:nucleotide-binding universal stress UspA family protein
LLDGGNPMTETNRTILVATDGSPTARAAAFAAVQFAKALEFTVSGLYVVDEILTLNAYADYQPELASAEEPASRTDLVTRFEQQGTEVLRQLEAQCRGQGLPITVEMEMGGVPEIILQRAEQAQLLALGRRGHGHPDDPGHLGRTFQSVAHRVRPPMLVGGGEQVPLQRFLLAYNGSPHAQEALEWAARLEKALAVEVQVLAVEEDGADLAPGWLEAAQAGLEQCGLGHCQFVTRGGQPAAQIVVAAEEKAVDLIIMGGYRHRALLEWVIGSTVDRVLRSTPLPVLVV